MTFMLLDVRTEDFNSKMATWNRINRRPGSGWCDSWATAFDVNILSDGTWLN